VREGGPIERDLIGLFAEQKMLIRCRGRGAGNHTSCDGLSERRSSMLEEHQFAGLVQVVCGVKMQVAPSAPALAGRGL
jgi:hypothetical protein